MFEIFLRKNWDERVHLEKEYQIPKSEMFDSFSENFKPPTRSTSLNNQNLSSVQSAEPIKTFSSPTIRKTPKPFQRFPQDPLDVYDRKLKQLEAEKRDLIDEKYINKYYQRRSKTKCEYSGCKNQNQDIMNVVS